MGKRTTFQERSNRGDCFILGCKRKPIVMITFKNERVWACKKHQDADGLFS